MSYDIRLVEEKYCSNYTSNIYEMFDAAFQILKERGDAQKWHHKWHDPLIDILYQPKDYLRKLIKELKENPDKYKKFNPENGWGDYDSAIKWLEDLLLNWTDGLIFEIDY